MNHRIVKHLLVPHCCPAPVSSTGAGRIESVIGSSERSTMARFCRRGDRSRRAVARPDSRGRAIDLFRQLRVWDTENNSVLIYVQLVDRGIEIVADRGINARADRQADETACMEAAFITDSSAWRLPRSTR
jgi:hypothetical protein